MARSAGITLPDAYGREALVSVKIVPMGGSANGADGGSEGGPAGAYVGWYLSPTAMKAPDHLQALKNRAALAEARFHALLENSPELLVVYDREDRVSAANSRWLRSMGFSTLDDVRGLSPEDLAQNGADSVDHEAAGFQTLEEWCADWFARRKEATSEGVTIPLKDGRKILSKIVPDGDGRTPLRLVGRHRNRTEPPAHGGGR
ncbi:MAG: PAS domain S-box protein [Thalassobaculum sp.]